jgi:hypothetical protein
MISIYDSIKLGDDHCWYCGKELYPSTRTQDHFFPKSKGGKLMVSCCENCNLMKGDLTPVEFIDYVRSLKGKHPEYQPWQKKFDRMIQSTESLWESVKWSVLLKTT